MSNVDEPNKKEVIKIRFSELTGSKDVNESVNLGTPDNYALFRIHDLFKIKKGSKIELFYGTPPFLEVTIDNVTSIITGKNNG